MSKTKDVVIDSLILINPILLVLCKDVITRGGALWSPSFIQLWGFQKPKTEPLHIFGTKMNLKSHFEQF